MGTKNNPGEYDCYANAEPDEPIFILRGKDPAASFVVELWAEMRKQMDPDADEDMLEEARECAEEMREWAIDLGRSDRVKKAKQAYEDAMFKILNGLDEDEEKPESDDDED